MVNTPTENHRDNALEQRSRELFNEQVANLDGYTRSRLNQARQVALDTARGRSMFIGARWLLPTGSVAALALVGMVSWQMLRPVDPVSLVESNLVVTNAVEDLEIITADAELELLQNMDFYVWLEGQSDSLAAEKS